MTGFFGKVTTHGDFVTRRLPPDVVQAWDTWLQECIHASRQQLGGDWLPHYLTSPVWRFAIGAGVLGQDGWAGVMMPSVDRVGRHFPLMLASPCNGPLLDCVQQLAWYDALDDLARCSLDAGFTLEQFDAAPSVPPAPVGVSVAVPGVRWRLPLQGAVTDGLTGALAEQLLQQHSLWWTEGSPSVDASLLMCKGMPDADAFAAMLDGSWHACGWSQPAG